MNSYKFDVLMLRIIFSTLPLMVFSVFLFSSLKLYSDANISFAEATCASIFLFIFVVVITVPVVFIIRNIDK